MRIALVISAALCLSACATSDIHPIPADWPSPVVSEIGCVGVEGIYLDPNSVRGERRDYQNGKETYWGGTYDAAWLIFGLYTTARPVDKSVKSRHFSLGFNSQNSLVFKYFIDGEVAASKEIASSEYKCDKGILKFVAYTRKGEVWDMFQNKGTITHSVEFLRSENHLYAKFKVEIVAVTYGVIPDNHTKISWPHFPAK